MIKFESKMVKPNYSLPSQTNEKAFSSFSKD